MSDALYNEYCGNIKRLSRLGVSTGDILNWLYCQCSLDNRIKEIKFYLSLRSFVEEECR